MGPRAHYTFTLRSPPAASQPLSTAASSWFSSVDTRSRRSPSPPFRTDLDARATVPLPALGAKSASGDGPHPLTWAWVIFRPHSQTKSVPPSLGAIVFPHFGQVGASLPAWATGLGLNRIPRSSRSTGSPRCQLRTHLPDRPARSHSDQTSSIHAGTSRPIRQIPWGLDLLRPVLLEDRLLEVEAEASRRMPVALPEPLDGLAARSRVAQAEEDDRPVVAPAKELPDDLPRRHQLQG